MRSVMTNPYGDIELDARGMRALAHPVRLKLLSHLQRQGPSTATRLAELVGASPSVASWHLRQLAAHGLVRDAEGPDRRQHGRERWWEAASRGFRFSMEGGREEAAAAIALEQVMESVDGDIPGQWYADTAPRLDPDWRRVAGRASTRVLVTLEEMEHLESAIEQLLAPYVLRKDERPQAYPEDVRMVRLLRYTLPEAGDPG